MTKNPVISNLREYYKARGFRVVGIRQSEDKIDITLRDKRTNSCTCPNCNKEVTYSALSRPRTYKEHPSEDNRSVFLHVYRREMHCYHCKKHFTAPHEIFPGRFATKDFENLVRFFKTNPNLTYKEIAEDFGVSEHYVRSI